MPAPLHAAAVELPDGRAPEHLWIADGQVSALPVFGADDLPGGWMLPGGLVDAHMHLTMNFCKVMPHEPPPKAYAGTFATGSPSDSRRATLSITSSARRSASAQCCHPK